MSTTHTPSSADYLLQFFTFEHLPADLRDVSAQVSVVAHNMARLLPAGPELTTGLRKLLEAKDCLVRAALTARDPSPATPIPAPPRSPA